MSHAAYTETEALSRETFLALMWALSYPGRAYTLPLGGNEGFHAIAETLLDIETSFYTSDDNLMPHLTRNGARSLPPERAAYHFYPVLTDDLLITVKQASVGSLMYPDQGATLIIGATLGTGQSFQLTGPGVPPASSTQIQVSGMPDTFWSMRESAIQYPRGWDIYLVDGDQVIGLPRTTVITVEE